MNTSADVSLETGGAENDSAVMFGAEPRLCGSENDNDNMNVFVVIAPK